MPSLSGLLANRMGIRDAIRTLDSRFLFASATWDPAATAATQGAEVSTTIAVPGAAVGDSVLVSHTSHTTNVDAQLIGQVDQADRVLVRLVNTKAVAYNLTTGTLKVTVIRDR